MTGNDWNVLHVPGPRIIAPSMKHLQFTLDKMAGICPNFKWSVPFEIRTIFKRTYFHPFKIQTCPDFRSPL